MYPQLKLGGISLVQDLSYQLSGGGVNLRLSVGRVYTFVHVHTASAVLLPCSQVCTACRTVRIDEQTVDRV